MRVTVRCHPAPRDPLGLDLQLNRLPFCSILSLFHVKEKKKGTTWSSDDSSPLSLLLRTAPLVWGCSRLFNSPFPSVKMHCFACDFCLGCAGGRTRTSRSHDQFHMEVSIFLQIVISACIGRLHEFLCLPTSQQIQGESTFVTGLTAGFPCI